MAEDQHVRARLEGKLAELLRRSGAIEDDLRGPLEADSEEQAVNLADDEALAGVDDVLQHEIGEIRQALLRLESGTYGNCAACGGAIQSARLEALPYATRCIECA